ncbi:MULTISPECIES: GtrA family protein [Lactobacillus]|uniref:Dolichyl-phosphate beta-D-mannosyltransferase n=1 Tax=Lactobacillus crispatus TaxID=47770 RepID=A0A226TIQ3_9LACO|nr:MULTISPECIES: GtrA family protein [Lactobacillus]OXC13414.1 dolichyl-phosphate beta-D-mannosyltransferase [Lactobacillus crispatus]OXC21073.1 dolichyl-phosphate beta-D-mannosyltransferase [Lactobacillus crispatus]OXC25294.1 dolichyl-phosphate beta-D-mannosyltransferase [Lactobacillus crispatus]OXC26060.1 dolichyl-phosphate beta-D-mannosyltransferase [Lactobacillus crispatus]OXC32491.1 dolichyl-phosphate beta-D-mannosyltransferase [Lactobacillus crispatus]
MEKIKTAIYSEDFVQLVKYVLIGVLGLVVDFGIYTILTHFKMNVEIANIISSTCGIINNFLWNSYTNFKVHDRMILRFISYFIVGQITTVFTTIFLFVFVTKLGYPHLMVKVIATFMATLIQFVINKVVTFRKAKKEEI